MITWAERAKAAISKTSPRGTAKADETVGSRLSAVSAAPIETVSVQPEHLSSVLTVPAPAVLEKHNSSNAVTEDPDRWCWPHSLAMNGAEIDTFTARLNKFTAKGLARNDGETLADKLVIRDRESDDRRVCLECSHFAGHGAGSWRCGNWQAAGVAIRSRDAQLPADLVVQLQRCDGFTAHPTPPTRKEPKMNTTTTDKTDEIAEPNPQPYEVVRFNALKHGILSRYTVLSHPASPTSHIAFDARPMSRSGTCDYQRPGLSPSGRAPLGLRRRQAAR